MKKFYKLVSIQKDAPSGLYHIQLDGRPVKCPSGTTLGAPSKPLAEAIMNEWVAQEEHIIPDTMPLMQILTTQQDRVSREREAMAAALYKYFDTDLLCYRAPQDDPPGVAEAQAEAWDQWLDWFETRFGERLSTTDTIVAVKHSKAAHEAVRGVVDGLGDAHFTALQLIVSLSGSLILGLAALEEALDAQAIFDAAHVEEDLKGKIYNEEFYGKDPLHAKKDDAMMRDLDAALAFLKLI